MYQGDILPYILDIQTTFPENYYTQDTLIEKLKTALSDKTKKISRMVDIHSNVLVGNRHLALPVEEYFTLKDFNQKNDYFIKIATEIGTAAVKKVLSVNDLKPSDISSIWSNTVTGFAVPSLDARIMNKLDFSSDVKRVPVIGLGCMAGAAVINRVAEYLKAYPKEAVLFMSVELCSLTFQMDDFRTANFVSTGLFGDGAAAVLMVGDEHPKASKAPLKWIDAKSVFFKNSESVMGWDIGSEGLKIVLSKSVPDVAKKELGGPLNAFLKANDLKLSSIDTFMAHPGGPKVLEAMEEVFGLGEKGLSESWKSLYELGNMSSVSVLDIIKRSIENRQKDAKLALSVAMGPGFSAEFGLFEWN